MSSELPKRQPVPTDSLEQLLIERIRKGAIELPLLPQVISIADSGDGLRPDAEAAKLAAFGDSPGQALAAHVIRIANSTAYMTTNPVVSLQHAVSMLGMNLMSELAFSRVHQRQCLQSAGMGHDESRGSGSIRSPAAPTPRKLRCTAVQRRKRLSVRPPAWYRPARRLANPGRPVQGQETTLSKGLMHQLLDSYYIQVGLLVADEWGLRRPWWSPSDFMWTTIMPKPPSKNV
ncbi:MAG: HDOD domain-containing protein [Nitrospira sp.]|nr:HDOD domain-containing protein [Nitrospira sp.]